MYCSKYDFAASAEQDKLLSSPKGETADSATLGKTAGKDAAQDKPTFVSLLGLPAAKDYADQLLAQALENIDSIARAGDGQADGRQTTAALRALATLLVQRTH